MPQRFLSILTWSMEHYWNFMAGLLFAWLSYFTELQGTIHVMLAAFVFDLMLGIWASVKIDKQRFKMDKFFTAIFRLILSCVLIMLLFAMGKEMHLGKDLYNIAAWLVTGFVGFSAAENAYKITGGKIFLLLKSFISKKVKDNTGIDINTADEPNR